MNMQSMNPDTMNAMTGSTPKSMRPTVAIQYEHPHELAQFVSDQVDSLDEEIRSWEERLYRLRTCRDALGVSLQYLNEVQQSQPGMVPSR